MTATRHNARYAKLRRQVRKVNNDVRESTLIKDWHRCSIPLSQLKIIPGRLQLIVQKIRRMVRAWYNRVDLLVCHATRTCQCDVPQISNARNTYTSCWDNRAVYTFCPFVGYMPCRVIYRLSFPQVFWCYKWDFAVPIIMICSTRRFAGDDSSEVADSMFR